MAVDQFPIEPVQLAQLIALVESGDLTGRGGKELSGGIGRAKTPGKPRSG